MDSQQANLCVPLPVFAEERADVFEDFVVELGGRGQSVGPGDGGEIFVAELELNGAGVEFGFAQAASHHLRQTHQRGFELGGVSGVFVVGVFVADGFGVDVGGDFGVEPASGVFSA